MTAICHWLWKIGKDMTVNIIEYVLRLLWHFLCNRDINPEERDYGSIYPSICISIHLSICTSIRLFIHQSINYFIHPYIYPSIINPSIHKSIYPPIQPSIHHIHPSINTSSNSFIYPSIHRSINQFIYLSNHSCIHPSFIFNSFLPFSLMSKVQVHVERRQYTRLIWGYLGLFRRHNLSHDLLH